MSQKKHNTPTPSFPLESDFKNIGSDVLADALYKQVLENKPTGIKELATETFSRSMAVDVRSKIVMWRPNNYRRQVAINGRSKRIEDKIKVLYGAVPKKGNKLIFVDLDGIKLQLGKNSLTGIWSQPIISGKKQTYLLEIQRKTDFKNFVDLKKAEISGKIDSAIFKFIKSTGLIHYKSDCPTWIRHEDWTDGDDIVKKLPYDCIVHEKLFKKVYSQGVEFISSEDHREPTENLISHINNSVLIDFAPQISKEISLNRDFMISAFGNQEKLINPLLWLKSNIQSVEDVIKLKSDIEKLSKSDKIELSNYLFQMEVF